VEPVGCLAEPDREYGDLDFGRSAAEDRITSMIFGGAEMLERELLVAARDRLAALDWDFADAVVAEGRHAVHPYPAKFIRELPRQLIDELSVEGDLVLDPFSGGGTTALEAQASGRRFVGIDANPVANLIARVKTTPISSDGVAEIERLMGVVQKACLGTLRDLWLPDIPNLDKWYDRTVFRQLGHLRTLVLDETTNQAAADVAMLAFITTANRLSYQESETRYVSAPRAIEPDAVKSGFLKDLRRISSLVSSLTSEPSEPTRIMQGDARDPTLFDNDINDVSLVVTSPPYPNSYDYHLYQRFRLFWLGEGPKVLRDLEIGSHLKNQSDANPIRTYLNDMEVVLNNLSRVLRQGGLVAMVVGSGVHKGELFDTASHLSDVAEGVGFVTVEPIHRNLPKRRRSVTHAGRRLSTEQIVLMCWPNSDRNVLVCPPVYEMYPYERRLQLLEARGLSGGSKIVESEGTLAVAECDASALRRMAFAHAIASGNSRVATFQGLIESGGDNNRSKDSTYATHGIHRYKGKFYPQLAKALINASSDSSGVVLDPFGGSGTVALEAVLGGKVAWSVDQNPLAVAVARAKIDLVTGDPGWASARLTDLVDRLSGLRVSPVELDDVFDPGLLDEINSWFPSSVVAKMASYLQMVRDLDDPRLINVSQVLLSDCVREISQQEPRDLRIRRRKEPIADADVFGLIARRLDRLVQRVGFFETEVRPALPGLGSATVVEGDSSAPMTGALPPSVSAVVSSPPYGTALPYIDTDRLSLAAVFGHTTASRRSIERVMVGSREIGVRDRRAWAELLAQTAGELSLPQSTIDFLQRYSAAVKSDENAGFRKQQAPAVLTRYFCAMSAVLSVVSDRIVAGGDVWLVLGDSRSTIDGKVWTIPTVDEVARIADFHGLSLVEEIPITVTREDSVHARNFIEHNSVLHLRRPEGN